MLMSSGVLGLCIFLNASSLDIMFSGLVMKSGRVSLSGSFMLSSMLFMSFSMALDVMPVFFMFSVVT